MPVSASQAWREAAATVDAQEVPLPTLELRHSTFDVPLRFVRDTQDKIFTLETEAPVDPGANVTFTRCPFQISYPRIGKFGTECALALDNVGREVSRYCQAAIALNEPIRVRFRAYLASDPATVGLGPFELTLRGVKIKGARLEGALTTALPRQMRVLTSVFDAVRFPALTLWT